MSSLPASRPKRGPKSDISLVRCRCGRPPRNRARVKQRYTIPLFGFLFSGLGLGLAAGLSPGPLLALLVAQTVRHGTREGLKVAVTPLLTDLPVIAASLLVLARLSVREPLLGAVAMAGAAYLIWLAWGSLRFRSGDWRPSDASPGSVRKALVTNLFNPHVYLFWIAVGSTMVLNAWTQHPSWAVAFLAGFYSCLVGSKLVLALLIGRSRQFLSGRGYAVAIRVSGVFLAGMAVWLARDGVRLLFG